MTADNPSLDGKDPGGAVWPIIPYESTGWAPHVYLCEVHGKQQDYLSINESYFCLTCLEGMFKTVIPAMKEVTEDGAARGPKYPCGCADPKTGACCGADGKC